MNRIILLNCKLFSNFRHKICIIKHTSQLSQVLNIYQEPGSKSKNGIILQNLRSNFVNGNADFYAVLDINV